MWGTEDMLQDKDGEIEEERIRREREIKMENKGETESNMPGNPLGRKDREREAGRWTEEVEAEPSMKGVNKMRE